MRPLCFFILLVAAVAVQAQSPDQRGQFFYKRSYTPSSIPVWPDAKDQLPSPFIEDDSLKPLIDMYWGAWKIAFTMLRRPWKGSPFVSDYVDEGFNAGIFQWDTHFSILFWNYAHPLFKAVQSHDNFYSRQHSDGYICREISEANGEDVYYEGKENAFNPPLFPWVEYQYYLISGDSSRFAKVIPPLERYAEWIELNRKKQGTRHGLYWQTNLGSGMDNSPRHGSGWVDISSQMVLFYKWLSRIEEKGGRKEQASFYNRRASAISAAVNKYMWNSKGKIYYDLEDNAAQTRVNTIASFWPLLAHIPNESRALSLIAHLQDSAEYWRHNVFPTLPRNDPRFRADGDYWLGGVWAPTNAMIIKGLQQYGHEKFAHVAALRYLKSLAAAYRSTGTLWENYSPEYDGPGNRSQRDFVGWTGYGPVAMLIENVLGISVDDTEVPGITWRAFLGATHGVNNLRFRGITASLRFDGDKVIVRSDKPFSLSFVKNEKTTTLLVVNRYHEFIIH